MTDEEFTRAFERGDIGPEQFPHRAHLRVAWTYLAESPSIDEATARMAAALKRFAAAAGKADRYHETITAFWMRLLAAVGATMPHTKDVDEILRACAYLLDKDTVLAFYSRERLNDDEARRTWVPPDLRPIDHHVAALRTADSPCDASNRPLPGRTA